MHGGRGAQASSTGLAILNAGAGDRRVLDMHDRVLALHADVDGDLNAIENLRFELPCEFDRDNYQRTLLLSTIYGMYLQLRRCVCSSCVSGECLDEISSKASDSRRVGTLQDWSTNASKQPAM
jgi:hypothetical protein